MRNTNVLYTTQWHSIADAAAILGVPVITLRRAIERNARRAKDGTITAEADGIYARKFQCRWRVALDPVWLNPRVARSGE
jgi:hypothetical protein